MKFKTIDNPAEESDKLFETIESSHISEESLERVERRRREGKSIRAKEYPNSPNFDDYFNHLMETDEEFRKSWEKYEPEFRKLLERVKNDAKAQKEKKTTPPSDN